MLPAFGKFSINLVASNHDCRVEFDILVSTPSDELENGVDGALRFACKLFCQSACLTHNVGCGAKAIGETSGEKSLRRDVKSSDKLCRQRRWHLFLWEELPSDCPAIVNFRQGEEGFIG
jgi:hypothetical protein